MATRLYLGARTPVVTPAIRGTWDQTANAFPHALDVIKDGGPGGGLTSIARSSATLNWDTLVVRFVSGPLAAQTISGTFNGVIGFDGGTNTALNLFPHVHMYVRQSDDSLRGTLLADYISPTEAVSFKAQAVPTQTLSNVTTSAGDRIILEIGYQAQSTITPGGLGIVIGGLGPDFADNDTFILDRVSWVEFSADLLWSGMASQVAQQAVETLVTDTTPAMQLSQQVVEVGIIPATVALHLTQQAIEVLLSPPPKGRVQVQMIG